jgi:hypothetical protein
MALSTRLRQLDDQFLSAAAKPERVAWRRRHGWALLLALALALLGFSAWAIASDHAALAGFPLAQGVGYLVWSGYLYSRRQQQ